MLEYFILFYMIEVHNGDAPIQNSKFGIFG